MLRCSLWLLQCTSIFAVRNIINVDAFRLAHRAQLNLKKEDRLTLEAFRTAFADVKMDQIVLDHNSQKDIFQSLSKGENTVSLNAFKQGVVAGDDRRLLRVLVESWYLDKVKCPGQCDTIDYAIGHYPPDLLEGIVGPCMIACYRVSADYNWSKTTQENYQAQHGGKDYQVSNPDEKFVGEFKKIRETRDHAYHGHYSITRQLWQDAAVHRIIDSTEGGQNQPWIVYTAGGMGVGKGWVLQTLSKKGVWAEERMVVVNPDSLKQIMPEFRYYSSHGQHNGMMTHLESGYIQEITIEAALNRRSHLVEDGSLRNANWYTGKGKRNSFDPASEDWIGIIPGLKKRHPKYRIAILHVTVQLESQEAVNALLTHRLASREKKTGRATPLKKAIDSISSSADTVNRAIELGLTDLVIEFNNPGSPGNLRPVEITKIVQHGEVQELGNQEDAWGIVGDNFGADALRNSDPSFEKKAMDWFEDNSLTRIEGFLDDVFPKWCNPPS